MKWIKFLIINQIKTIMKKILLNVLFGVALFGYTASAQSKIDTPATYKEAWQKQKKAAAKQELLAKEQSEKAKEHQKMMDAVKQEMLKDGLIQKNENYELIINKREMLINGKKLSESVHHKYIELINSKRNKAFGDKEEWKIKE